MGVQERIKSIDDGLKDFNERLASLGKKLKMAIDEVNRRDELRARNKSGLKIKNGMICISGKKENLWVPIKCFKC